MLSHIQQVEALIAEAAELPDGRAKYDRFEEAVRLADLHQDVRLGIKARRHLMSVARALVRGDRLAVAFTWCLHKYDDRPDLFAGRDLLAEYKSVIEVVTNYDTITRQQIEDMLADYRARLDRAGQSPAHVWRLRRAIAYDLGDPPMGVEAVTQLGRMVGKEGRLDPMARFRFALLTGNDDEAFRLAANVGRRPTPPLDEKLAWLELMLLQLTHGRLDDLARWCGSVAKSLAIGDCYYWEYGPPVLALALGGLPDAAVRLCGDGQRALGDIADPLTRLHFHTDMGAVFERLLGLGRESVAVRFTDEVPGKLPDGRYAVAEVRAWMGREAADLAARFDRRNGTEFFADRIRHRQELQRYALPEVGRQFGRKSSGFE